MIQLFYENNKCIAVRTGSSVIDLHPFLYFKLEGFEFSLKSMLVRNNLVIIDCQQVSYKAMYFKKENGLLYFIKDGHQEVTEKQ